MYIEAHRGEESIELIYIRKNWNLFHYMESQNYDVYSCYGKCLEKSDIKK